MRIFTFGDDGGFFRLMTAIVLGSMIVATLLLLEAHVYGKDEVEQQERYLKISLPSNVWATAAVEIGKTLADVTTYRQDVHLPDHPDWVLRYVDFTVTKAADSKEVIGELLIPPERIEDTFWRACYETTGMPVSLMQILSSQVATVPESQATFTTNYLQTRIDWGEVKLGVSP